ncbi:putative protease Do-like 14 isoform X2 [Rhododendron vialii]|uniref:putative protease Do-like 14 isoform X2 n=1 Tax=Rhododendron vialii TaxID=182163 RepID=UPI00265DD7EC|nr:putative protease Do-like 14 isoform X2 [Rhododendron vialii]
MKLDGRDSTFSPWKRRRSESKGGHIITRHSFSEEFDRDIYANMDLDIDTKRAAQKVSASLVSLVSRTGSEPFFMGSGTIIESEEVDGTHFSTILTSASLLRSTPESDAIPDDIKIDVYLSDGKSSEGQVFTYDFHYNIATIKIKTDLAFPSATLRFLDDSISVDPSAISESSQLRRHSDLFKLCPGDMVVAVGRYFDQPYELMAAPGKFSLDVFKFDCKELFRATCQISKCGIGGPLINLYGEVIGVNFYDRICTPFLPINITAKCLEHFKKYGRFCRPWLGMEMTNLYAENLGTLEKFLQKFPNISEGVLVEKFYGMIMEKTGESLELVVLRETNGQRLQTTVKASEASRDKFYRWPLPEECTVHVDRVRW